MSKRDADIATPVQSVTATRTRNRVQMNQYSVRTASGMMVIEVAWRGRGSHYLLIVIHRLTKPTPFRTKRLLQWTKRWLSAFMRLRSSAELHSDQGRNFDSRLMQEVLKLRGVNKTCTSPLHPNRRALSNAISKR
jgi:hypothetical protein